LSRARCTVELTATLVPLSDRVTRVVRIRSEAAVRMDACDDALAIRSRSRGSGVAVAQGGTCKALLCVHPVLSVHSLSPIRALFPILRFSIPSVRCDFPVMWLRSRSTARQLRGGVSHVCVASVRDGVLSARRVVSRAGHAVACPSGDLTRALSRSRVLCRVRSQCRVRALCDV